jgi:glycerol uptake facilitator-like aquaporin
VPDFLRRATAEALGTALLVTAVVGSGIMADRLTDDAATALLANSLATASALVVLVTILSPVSGAHFNPMVTLVFLLMGKLTRGGAALYVAAQIAGGIAGTVLAHAMFELPLVEASATARAGTGAFVAEVVATAGLVLTILLGLRSAPAAVPGLVGLYIGAAYWFTASTSFANPAVTIARTLTDTFAGIQPGDAPAFIAAQLLGGIAGFAMARWLQRGSPA